MAEHLSEVTPEALLQQRKALAEQLREAGVGMQSDRFASLARPSVVLEAGGSAGVSKLGGCPALPPGMDWPIRAAFSGSRDRKHLSNREREILAGPAPLSLIAQVDLAFLAGQVAGLPGLPERGVLYFFYDVLHEGWGFDPADRNGFRIVWADAAASDLAEATLPEPAPWVFPEVPLGARYKLDPVDVETRAFEKIDTTDPAASDTYLDWLSEHRFDNHKLGGWPDVIQGEMESECALASNGLNCGSSDVYVRPSARGILAEETDWRLLLQVASDSASQMMWGDLGNLYVWIRESDLKARRFEKCWVILQCS